MYHQFWKNERLQGKTDNDSVYNYSNLVGSVYHIRSNKRSEKLDKLGKVTRIAIFDTFSISGFIFFMYMYIL